MCVFFRGEILEISRDHTTIENGLMMGVILMAPHYSKKEIPISDRKRRKRGTQTLRSIMGTFPGEYHKYYDGFNR